MGKGIAVNLVALIIVSAGVVLMSAYFAQGTVDKAKTHAGTTAGSVSGAGASFECEVFCGKFISKSESRQKQGMCGTCDTSSGKKASFVCDESGEEAKKCNEKKTEEGCSANPAYASCDVILQPSDDLETPSDGGGSGKSIILSNIGRTYTVQIKGASGKITDAQSIDVLKLSRESEDFTKKCGVPSPANQDCFTKAGNTFTLPANPLPDGRYNLYIKADNAEMAQILNWNCPQISITGSFGAGKIMFAEFETSVNSIDKVSVGINGHSSAGKTKEGDKAKIVLPKLGSIIEGNNRLTIARTDDGGVCIKDGAVKNEIIKEYDWTCPDAGCYESGSNQYMVKEKQNGGGYADFQTGCSYKTQIEPKCAHGCIDGKCRMMDLKIDSITFGGLKMYDAADETRLDYVYGAKSDSDDKEVVVAVSNIGQIDAGDVSLAMKFGGADSEPFSADCVSGNKYKIASGKKCTFRFMVRSGSGAGELPTIRISDILSQKFPEKSFSVVADDATETDANAEDDTYSLNLKIYPQCDDTSTCKKDKSVCEKCPLCTWVANSCKSG